MRKVSVERGTKHAGYEYYFTGNKDQAGRNCTKTASVQVRQNGKILKQFRYRTNVPGAMHAAYQKAIAWLIKRTGK